MIRDAVGEPTLGAEIGVFKGQMAAALREAFPKCELLLVDPWQAWQAGDSYYDNHKRTGKLTELDWDEVYHEAFNRMIEAGGKNRISRTTSKWASRMVEPQTFDFVFIDANHSYVDVKNDIELWLPKVRPGGLICGHDYGGRYKGVARAVHNVLGKDDLIIPGNRTRLWGFVV